jgi:hypothetical protein
MCYIDTVAYRQNLPIDHQTISDAPVETSAYEAVIESCQKVRSIDQDPKMEISLRGEKQIDRESLYIYNNFQGTPYYRRRERVGLTFKDFSDSHIMN